MVVLQSLLRDFIVPDRGSRYYRKKHNLTQNKVWMGECGDRSKRRKKVTDLVLKNTKNDTISLLVVGGVSAAIGLVPNTEYLRGVSPLDERGYIITTELMEATVPGILLAGDIRHNSVKQAIVAAGDGAVDTSSTERFVGSL